MHNDFVQDAVDDLNNEVAFLRYFFNNVGPALGPADTEIMKDLAEGFIEDGGTVPDSYRERLGLDEEEED